MAFTPKLGKPVDPAKVETFKTQKQEIKQLEAQESEGGSILDTISTVDRTVTDVGRGAAKGVGSTLHGLSQLGDTFARNTMGRALAKITGNKSYTQPSAGLEKKPDFLVPKTTAEKVGFAGEQVAEFFVPSAIVSKAGKAVDVAAKGSKILKARPVLQGAAKTLGRAAIEGASAGAVRAAQTGGDLSETGTAASIAAAIPVAGRAIQLGGKAVPRIASILSGVPRETIQRASDPVMGKRIADAVKYVSENKAQPYFGLTDDIGKSIGKARASADDFVKKAVGKFSAANKGKVFDVSSKYDDVVKALEPFRTSGIIVPRSGRGFKIAATPQSPFTQREVTELNKVLEKLRVSKQVSAEDVLALKRSFATAYDAVPLGVNGNPRPYHAAVMALKEKADDAIQGLLPKELQQAFGQYTRFERFMEKFGTRLVDAEGKVKPNAEQFISNLGNLNKGELRETAKGFRDFLGKNVEEEVEIIKDAQKLLPLFAATGSRTQDILRSLLAAGVGFGASGGVGTIAALAATSPRAVGVAARGISKIRGAMPKSTILDAIKQRVVGAPSSGGAISDVLKKRYQSALQKTK